jgi:ankyrin repeat protein
MAEAWVQEDDGAGNKYWYNTETGESSWDAPGTTGAAAPEGSTMAVGQVWYEQADEAGNAYYYNTKTHECQWEKPRDFDGKPAAEGAMPAGLQSLMTKAFEGKLKLLDKDTQKTLDAAAKKQKDAEAARDAKVQAGEEHWVECYDPQSEAYYYYGQYAGECVWEKPENYVMAADDETFRAVIKIQCLYRKKVAMGKYNKRKEQKWVETLDEASGHYYYYNTATGECVWEKPKDFVGGAQTSSALEIKIKKALEGKLTLLEKDVQLKLEAVKKQQQELEAKRAEGAAPGQEANWIEVYDPASEAFYYWGKDTDACVWDKPENYVLAADDVMMTAVIKIQCAWRKKVSSMTIKLKKGRQQLWKSAKDPESGKAYYYNTKTDECVWEKPKGFDGGGSADGALAKQMQHALKTAKRLQTAEGREVASFLKRNLEELQRLKKEGKTQRWASAYDPTADMFYYYDVKTHETVWERPADFVMDAECEEMRAAIMIQCTYRTKVAWRRQEYQMIQKGVVSKDADGNMVDGQGVIRFKRTNANKLGDNATVANAKQGEAAKARIGELRSEQDETRRELENVRREKERKKREKREREAAEEAARRQALEEERRLEREERERVQQAAQELKKERRREKRLAEYTKRKEVRDAQLRKMEERRVKSEAEGVAQRAQDEEAARQEREQRLEARRKRNEALEKEKKKQLTEWVRIARSAEEDGAVLLRERAERLKRFGDAKQAVACSLQAEADSRLEMLQTGSCYHELLEAVRLPCSLEHLETSLISEIEVAVEAAVDEVAAAHADLTNAKPAAPAPKNKKAAASGARGGPKRRKRKPKKGLGASVGAKAMQSLSSFNTDSETGDSDEDDEEDGASQAAKIKARVYTLGELTAKAAARAKVEVLEQQNAQGETLLLLACASGWVEGVRLLLQQGADPNHPDGQTHRTSPLHECARATSGVAAGPIARMLIEAGADVLARDIDGSTPLHIAARSLNRSVAVQLLAADRTGGSVRPHVRTQEPAYCEEEQAALAALGAKRTVGPDPLNPFWFQLFTAANARGRTATDIAAALSKPVADANSAAASLRRLPARGVAQFQAFLEDYQEKAAVLQSEIDAIAAAKAAEEAAKVQKKRRKKKAVDKGKPAYMARADPRTVARQQAERLAVLQAAGVGR